MGQIKVCPVIAELYPHLYPFGGETTEIIELGVEIITPTKVTLWHPSRALRGCETSDKAAIFLPIGLLFSFLEQEIIKRKKINWQ